MAVTSEVRVLLDTIAAVEAPPLEQQSPADVRAAFAALSVASGPSLPRVADRVMRGPGGDLPLRVYTPAGASGGVLVYFHGGGFVIGSAATHDHTCRSLAEASGATVVSVDYRLAPEHPYPAAVEDARAAVRWVVEHAAELGVDADRLAVGGDSAGGNLAAVLAQGEPRMRFQLLVYPWLDMALGHPSIEENAEGLFLTRDMLHWFRDHYLGAGDTADPLVSPLRAPSAALRGLPSALVITAEHDPLRDEGEAYGEALRGAGVAVTIERYDGLIHGFVSMAGILPEGEVAIERAGEVVRQALEVS